MDTDLLPQLSDRLAALGAGAARHVVRVEGRRRGHSSGVVWSADGIVLTALHALERDEEIAVGLPSGETAAAEVAGRDPTTGLALLRVRASGLAAVEWPADDAVPAAGQLALGVSRPGVSPRVALGVVSRVAGEFRGPGGGKIDRYVETSLALHRGLSGGIAVGPRGDALGLLTAALVRGTAMVIPPATLRRVAKSLLTHGEVRRGYLGIATVPVALSPALAAATGEELALLVQRVEPQSPAERAGLLLGDAILSVGGERLQDPGELLALLSEDRIGDTITLRLVRAGEIREVAVTVGARGRWSRT